MSSIPLPALAIRPQQEDPLQQYARVVQLQGLLANQRYQQQAQPLAIQAEQQRIQQEQSQNQLLQQQVAEKTALASMMPNHVVRDDQGKVTGYDFAGLANEAMNSGKVSLPTIQAMNTQQQEAQIRAATLTKDQLDNQAKLSQQAFEHIEAVRSAQDPFDRRIAYTSALKWMQQNKMDISQMPPEAPDDAGLTQYEMRLGMGQQILSDSQKKQEIAKSKTQQEKEQREATFGSGAQGDWVRSHLQAQGLEATPENIAKAQDAYNQATKIAPAEVRANVWMNIPRGVVVDPNTNQAVYATPAQIIAADKAGTPLQAAQYSPQVQGALTAGKEAVGKVPVIQTALHHLDALDSAANALQTGDVKALNALANAWGAQVGNTPLATYRGLQQVVKGDILAASSAVGQKNEMEEKAIDSVISPDIPIPAIHASIGSVRTLMNQRLQAKGEVFKDVSGGNVKNIFTPQAGGARPAGASAEVHDKTGKLIGHVVNNKYVPLGSQ